MASSSSSSSDSTSLDGGIGITGVSTATGGLTFLFLFFFSAAFTTATLAAVVVADYFAVAALVLRLGVAAPLASGPVPASPPTSTDESLIILQQPSCWRLVLVRPQLPLVLLTFAKRCWAPKLTFTILQQPTTKKG
jgi:hypothetical protein